MGNRLSKIYTRTGDQGETGLATGERVAKDSPRMEAIGTIDELNSAIGMMLVYDVRREIRTVMDQVQHRLFDLGGGLSMPGTALITEDDVTDLENWLDQFNSSLAPLKEFILPGGGAAAAACHLARCICRRAERRLLTLNRLEQPDGIGLKYLNRLSDLLFVLGRILARDAGGMEVMWRPKPKAS